MTPVPHLAPALVVNGAVKKIKQGLVRARRAAVSGTRLCIRRGVDMSSYPTQSTEIVMFSLVRRGMPCTSSTPVRLPGSCACTLHYDGRIYIIPGTIQASITDCWTGMGNNPLLRCGINPVSESYLQMRRSPLHTIKYQVAKRVGGQPDRGAHARVDTRAGKREGSPVRKVIVLWAGEDT